MNTHKTSTFVKSKEEIGVKPVAVTMGNHQLVIITRLLQLASNMHSIDELLLWLAHILVQRLDIQVIQFWTKQAYSNGRIVTELRTMVSKNTALPQQIVINKPCADMITRLLLERQSNAPQPVAHVFTSYHTALLTRYKINYWACHYVESPVLIPPIHNNVASEKVATPLVLAISVFCQRPPAARLMPTIAHIMEQVVPIAHNRGLLLTPAVVPYSTKLYPTILPLLTEIYPRQVHEVESEQASNPFAITTIITDKYVRRLYMAIDGSRSITELAHLLQMNAGIFYRSLKTLIKERRIVLYGPQEELIDNTHFLKALVRDGM